LSRSNTFYHIPRGQPGDNLSERYGSYFALTGCSNRKAVESAFYQLKGSILFLKVRSFLIYTLTVVVLGGCTSRLNNSIDDLALLCGKGYEPGKTYIKVSDATQMISPMSPKLELLTIPKDKFPITERGCIERPKQDEIYVTNSSRTSGTWISSTSNKSVELTPIKPANLPSACDSVVHGDGRGFTLHFRLDENAETRHLQSIEVKLQTMATGEKIGSWESRPLEQTNTFKFSEDKAVLTGEYRLLSDIKDAISGVSITSECTLRIDYSALLISPAESVKTKRIYNHQEVLLVEPGYNVNFYVHEGYKDVSIEYCLKKITSMDLSNTISAPLLKCETTLDFLNSKAIGLDEGFWLLNYRGQRGLVQNAWQHAVFLVDKVCSGTFDSIASLQGRSCTTIKGSLSTPDLTLENMHELDSIGAIFGAVDISTNDIKIFNALPNLGEVFGDMRISVNGTSQVRGFENLRRIHGDFTISGSIEGFDAFNYLETVTGTFSFMASVKSPNFSDFANLRTVEGSVEIGNLADSTLNLLKNLEVASELKFDRVYKLSNLNGFEKIRQLDSLSIMDCPDFESFTGLRGLNSINKVVLSDLPSLKDFSTFQTSTINQLDIQNTRNLKSFASSLGNLRVLKSFRMRGQNDILDLKTVQFGDFFEDLEIYSDALISLDGMEYFERLKSVKLSIPTVTTLENFHNLVEIGTIEILGSGISSLDGLAKLKKVSISMVLRNNQNLVSLSGMNRLEFLANFEISDSLRLVPSGLKDGVEIFNFQITNTGITHLDFFPKNINLHNLYIDSNSQIQNLFGLSKINVVNGNLFIRHNSHLLTLDGIQGLTVKGSVFVGSRVGSNLEFSESPFDDLQNALVDYTALAKLQEIGENIYILTSTCFPLATKFAIEANANREFPERPAGNNNQRMVLEVTEPENCAVQ